MAAGGNSRKSLAMIVASMLIFGSIGVFRRFIPLSSPFLAFSRGLIGGLVIFMVKKNMDEVDYAYKDGQNILTMRKRIRG